MWLFGGIGGLFIGALAFGSSGWLLGAILGSVAGMALKGSLRPDLSEIRKQLRQLDESVQTLNRRIDELQNNASARQTLPDSVLSEAPAAGEEFESQVTEPEYGFWENEPSNETSLPIMPELLPLNCAMREWQRVRWGCSVSAGGCAIAVATTR